MKKSIGILLLTAVVMLATMVSWAMAQRPSSPADYRAQLEGALGGKIIAVQIFPRYPTNSLTQAVNLSVSRAGARTEILPIQVIFVKAGLGYAVEAVNLVNTSAAYAKTVATKLPVPSPGTGSGGGGGGGTTTAPRSSPDDCYTKCFTNASGSPINWVKAAACYMACKLGLPIPAQ